MLEYTYCKYTQAALEKAGYTLFRLDNVLTSPDNHEDLMSFIAAYNPLPEAQEEAINRINVAAGETRTRYVTAVPSQDATYQMKLEDAKAFMQAGYPEASISNYLFIAGEADALQVTGQVAADLVLATANGWTQLAAGIENERRKGLEGIKRCTVWSDCSTIADTTVSNLEGL